MPRLVIAEDSELLRLGIVRLLEDHGIETVAQAGNAEELLRQVGGYEPDVVITDIRMPPGHTDEGLHAAETIAERHPNVGVLVLSQHLEPRFAFRLLEAGTPGRGYLLKDSVQEIEEFVAAVLRVADGGSVVDPAIVQLLLSRERTRNPIEALSPRELEVLSFMAQGRSNSAIAEQLFVGIKTVESHVHNIFMKLGIDDVRDDHRRVLAVIAFLRG